MENKQRRENHTKSTTAFQTSLLIFTSRLDSLVVLLFKQVSRLSEKGQSLSPFIPPSRPPPPPNSYTQSYLRLRRFNPRNGSGSHSQFCSSLAMKSDSRLRFFMRHCSKGSYSPPTPHATLKSQTAQLYSTLHTPRQPLAQTYAAQQPSYYRMKSDRFARCKGWGFGDILFQLALSWKDTLILIWIRHLTCYPFSVIPSPLPLHPPRTSANP